MEIARHDELGFSVVSKVPNGDVLLDMMRDRPDQDMMVLCGHTHHSGTVQMLPNLQVLTGTAEYGAPCIAQILEVE